MRSVVKLYSRGVFCFVIAGMLLSVGVSRPQAGDRLPAPLPGNPEYLIRVIYFIPSDRLLDYENHPDCPKYNRKIKDAVARIRSLMETIDDFVNWQITDVFAIPDPPGTRLNFERESNGTGLIKVHVIHGKLKTEGKDGYWRDDEGKNAGGAL
jgi:hypothetical protein